VPKSINESGRITAPEPIQGEMTAKRSKLELPNCVHNQPRTHTDADRLADQTWRYSVGRQQ